MGIFGKKNITRAQRTVPRASHTPSTPAAFDLTIDKQPKQSSLAAKLRGTVGTIALLVTAPLLAVFITSHVFHSYEVDGSSMETTLQNGDRLIVYKLPKTLSNLSGNDLIPSRYDIVVFDRPRQISAPNSVSHLIKRVIALPGERVTVKNGSITVYNGEFPDGFNPDAGMEYEEGIVTTTGSYDVTVGPGQVFVVGDNRTNSTDSRVFGPIDTDLLVGKATSRFVPVGNMKRL